MRNPFIIDRPLSDQDLYYGREEAVAQLQHELGVGQQLFVILGPAGCGKTSFINQLSLRLTRRSVRIIQWPEAQTVSSATVDQMQTTLGHWLDDATPEHAAPDAPEIICVDHMLVDEPLDQSSWQHCLRSCRKQLASVPNRALLLAITCPPGVKLSAGEATVLPLTLLSEADVQDLLMIPSRRRLAWGLDVIQRIFRLTGGDPYLCQLYGHLIFERRQGAGWVSMADLEDVSMVILERESDRFRDLWGACSPQAQLVACSLAEMAGRRDLGSALDVAIYLRQLHVDVLEETICAGLDELVDLGILAQLGGETFRFVAGLMRQWLRAHHDAKSVVHQYKVFRQHHLKPTSFLHSGRIDWVGLVLWAVAAMLVVTIAFVWRSRQTTTFWTANPTPSHANTTPAVETRVLPTPEKGVAPGHIVYQAKHAADQYWSIYAMRSDGSDPLRLTDVGGNDTGPVWSPDGRRIAFVSDRDGNREIYVMSSDGNSQINLTLHGAEDWTPTWSPDGNQIAFASFREGNWDLYVMRDDGTEIKRLTDTDSAEYGPSWSPDGELLAFVSNRDGNLEIYVMTVDSQETWRITEDEATDQTPSWSPDGSQLIWESYRENNMELFVANSDGSEVRTLSRDAYADDHGACWSPWGRRVVYYSNRDEGWDIYTLDIESGERVNLTMSPMLEQAPHWGP